MILIFREFHFFQEPKEERLPRSTHAHIHCSLSFRGPHVRLALLTELPSLNKEFIVIIILL